MLINNILQIFESVDYEFLKVIRHEKNNMGAF